MADFLLHPGRVDHRPSRSYEIDRVAWLMVRSLLSSHLAVEIEDPDTSIRSVARFDHRRSPPSIKPSMPDHEAIRPSRTESIDEIFADTHLEEEEWAQRQLDSCASSQATQSQNSLQPLNTPPTTLPAPADIAESLDLTPSVQSSVLSASNGDGITPPTHTGARGSVVLYSAIGSLEDPTSRSYKGKKGRLLNPTKKFEFPSTHFIPPTNQAKNHVNKNHSKKSNLHQSLLAGVEPIPKPSNLRQPSDEPTKTKKVSIKEEKKKPKPKFRPTADAYTPRMGKKEIKYKPAEMRTPIQMASPMGTLQRPNFKDALRRVAMILRQHIVKIERRFEDGMADKLFARSMRDEFSEEKFVTPTYKCTMVRVPMARSGMVCGLKRIRKRYQIPSEEEIYEFGHQLFNTVQLSSECSIVCLIYVERVMESSKVPLLASTWRPIFMCGLLLASKVWQDLSSWNIEFASVYPQYSLDSINRLELNFLRRIKWDLYISSTTYAKYYFALRSLVEKPDFRQRYNRMVGGVDKVEAAEALKIEKRSSMVKEEALLQLSRSM